MRFKRVALGAERSVRLLVDRGEGWTLVEGEVANRGLIDILEGVRIGARDVMRALDILGPPPGDETVDLLPFSPRSFRDFMLYEDHVIAAGRGLSRRFLPSAYAISRVWETLVRRPFPPFRPHWLWYRQPIYYLGNHLNMLSEDALVEWPGYSEALDYELELALVLSTPLKDATPEEAISAVGGFLVLNDFSARDVQLPEMRSGFGPQKAKHFLTGLSSVVATADAVIPHLESLRAEVHINGQTVCTTTTREPFHTLGEALAHASRGEQLHPGELLASGTLPGGSGMENGRWLSPGDEIRLWIEHIGSLKNTVGQRS